MQVDDTKLIDHAELTDLSILLIKNKKSRSGVERT